MRARLGERLAQQLDTKYLGRLRGPALRTRRRLDHTSGLHPLDRVGDRHREDRRPARARRFDDARHRRRPHEGPRRVVHRHPLDVGCERREPRAHRVLALGAAVDRRRELREQRELRSPALPALAIGPRDHGHHAGDRRGRRHCGERVPEQRPACQRNERLGLGLSEALAATGGENESGDAHGRRE
jgi:hypothetical protein